MLGLGTTIISGAQLEGSTQAGRSAPAKFSQFSADLDGVNDTVTFPNTTFWPGLLGNLDWSVSYWVKYATVFPTSTARPSHGICNMVNFNSSAQLEQVQLGGIFGPNFGSALFRNKLACSCLLQNSTFVISTRTTDLSSILSDDTWFHVVIASEKDGSIRSTKIYINGVDRTELDVSTSFRFGNITAPGGVIGAEDAITVVSDFAEMNIDDLSAYSKVLSSSEVSDIYNGGVPKDESSRSNLIGYWKFGDGDDRSRTSVLDQSSNSNDFTLSGATFVEDTP